MQTILRPVYNRPEMLRLSLDYEIAARQDYFFSDKLKTIFIIECGSPKEVHDIIKTYPFEYECVYRSLRLGLTTTILEGLKTAFSFTNDFVIYIEDDILVHKTYFYYLDSLLSAIKVPYSVLASWGNVCGQDIFATRLAHSYAALAPLITKEFFNNYVYRHCNSKYYKNPSSHVKAFFAPYMRHPLFKLKGSLYCEQAGLINRLVDVALIEENKCVITPEVDRCVHIGYFGENRPGGVLLGNCFEERLNNLKEIIKSPEIMFANSAFKDYNDYRVFSEELLFWAGGMYLKHETLLT